MSNSIERVATEIDFSGVVQVSRQGRILFEGAWGLADRAHGIANNMGTQFSIASGTKGLTTLAIMSLVEEGSLTLGDSVRGVLGNELELVDPSVTVGHLLAHTSGIGDYLDEEVLSDISDYTLAMPVHQLESTVDYLAVLRGYPMKSDVGERFAYSNSGFVILALVVEAITDSSFYDIVAQRVCVPAGMAATAFLRFDQLPGSAAIGYLPTEGGWRTNQFHLPIRGSGDGGAYSTVGDFAAFWPALFAGKILSASLVNEMVRPHNDVPSESLRYGLGFWLRPDRDTVLLEGYDPGVSFRSVYDPGSALLYTVISNTATGAWPIVRLLDEALPELAQPR